MRPKDGKIVKFVPQYQYNSKNIRFKHSMNKAVHFHGLHMSFASQFSISSKLPLVHKNKLATEQLH